MGEAAESRVTTRVHNGPITGHVIIDSCMYYIIHKLGLSHHVANTTRTTAHILSTNVLGRNISVALTRDTVVLVMLLVFLFFFLLLSWQPTSRITELEAEVIRLKEWSNQLLSWQQAMMQAVIRPHQ